MKLPKFEAFAYYYLVDIGGSRPWVVPNLPYHAHPQGAWESLLGFTYNNSTHSDPNHYSMSGYLDLNDYGKTWKAFEVII